MQAILAAGMGCTFGGHASRFETATCIAGGSSHAISPVDSRRKSVLGTRRAKQRVQSGIFIVDAGETFDVVELVTTNLVRLELANGDRPCLLWSFVRSISDPLKPSEGG